MRADEIQRFAVVVEHIAAEVEDHFGGFRFRGDH